MGREASSFDWLPAGWEVDVKVRNTGKKDRYYIDPASGIAFRSMNEVFRYLETGKIGRRAFKHKDKGPMKRGSRYHPIFPTAEAGKLRLPKKNKAQKLIPVFQNLNSDAEVDLQKLDFLKPCEGEEKPYEFIFPEAAKLVVNLRIEKRLYTKDIVDKSKGQIRIIKRRKVLPHRTSKVDGGEAELPQVLKAWKRFCQAEARSTGADEGIHTDNYDKFLESEECRRAKTGNVADLDILASRSNPLYEEEAKHSVPNVLQEEHAHPGVNEFTGSEQQEVPFSLSSGELWNDPCIEFAIKTLTGDLPICKNDTVTTSPEPSMELHDAGSASSQDSTLEESRGDPCFGFVVKTLTGNVPKVENQVENVTLQQQSSSKGGRFNWPTFADYKVTGDLPISKEDTVTTSPDPSMELHDAGSASSQDSTLEEARGDPCFGLAVKTLTGNVPKVENNQVGNVPVQQQSSSKGGGFNWPTFADYRVTGDLPIGKDDTVTTSPETSMELHDAGSASSQDPALEEARGDPCFGLAVKTLAGNVQKMENNQVGNVTLQQRSSSKGGRLNWPTFADYRITGDLPIGEDEMVTTSPKPSMELHDAGSASTQDSALEEARGVPCFRFAVKTLTGNVPKMENNQVGDVTLQQQSSSKGGGLNWPTFTDYRVAGDLPIGKGDTLTTSPEPSMELHDAGSASTHDSVLKEAKGDPCFGFAINTLTGNVPKVENNQVSNVTLQQHSSSKGGGLNWPTFADYRTIGGLPIGKDDSVTTSPKPSMEHHDTGSASTQDSALEEARVVPCFGFAVNALTGNVPKVENNQVGTVTLQQQSSSKGGRFNFPTFADYRTIGDLPISKDETVTTSPKPSMELHDTGSASTQDSALEEARVIPCFGFAVKTLTGNVPKAENKQVGNVTLQQQASSKGGGLNWPTFADYRVAGNLPIGKSDSVTTIPEPSMELHAAGSASNQDSALKEAKGDPCSGFAVKTLTSTAPQVEKNQVGNLTLQQQCSSKGGGSNWPTFADYRVTGFSWRDYACRHSATNSD